MNLPGLLTFLPLVIGAFLAYHLIFRQQLPSKSLGAVLSYFLGIIIIFAAIFWLVTTFLADWATNLLQEGTTAEWQQFIQASENVVEDALGTDNNSNAVVVPATPSTIIIVATPTPLPGGTVLVVPESEVVVGPTTYTVVVGDTLYGIARRFKTTVNEIMIANNLTSYTIYPGQVLTIPAPSPSPPH